MHAGGASLGSIALVYRPPVMPASPFVCIFSIRICGRYCEPHSPLYLNPGIYT